MGYDKETMRALFKAEYGRHLSNMKNECSDGNDIRWGFYNKCQGAVELAMLLGILSDEEMQECYKEAHDVYFENMHSECGKEEDKLPFEEVPEEEQEIFEIEDLPFPKVMDKTPEEFIEIPEENVLPFPPAEDTEEDEPGDDEFEELRSQVFGHIKKKLEDGDFYAMNYPFDKAILSRVHKEIPGCCVVPGKETLYLVDEEDIEYLQEHLEDELDRAESEAFDFRLALEHCWPHVRRYHDKLCAEGRRFSVHNGVLVKGNPEAYAAFQESEEAYAAFMERRVQ